MTGVIGVSETPVSKETRVFPEPIDELRFSLEDVDRREARGRHGGWSRGREEERARLVLEDGPQVRAAGHVSAEHADRLGEGPHLDVHAAVEAEVIDRATSVAAQDSGGVRIVDVDDCAGVFGGLDDLGQPSNVAVHAEDAIGQDQDRAIRPASGRADVSQRLAQRVHVGVRKDLALGLGEADAIDHRSVVECVRDDHRALRGEDRDDPGIAGEARLEGEDGFDLLELRQARLELFVEAHRSGDRAHRTRAGAVLLHCPNRGLAQPRVRVQSQVVVTRQRDHLAAVDHASAALLALHNPEAAEESFGLQLVDLTFQERKRTALTRGRGPWGAEGGIGHGRSTTFPACREAIRSKPRSQSARSNRWVRMGVTSREPERSKAWVRSQVS